MINCVIIDDEQLARDRIKDLLANHEEKLKILGEADNGTKGINLIERMKPDLVFLDIQMPDMTGFDMLSQLTYQPKIIFTTAYSDYAIEAFENLAIDYLVKPITVDRFSKSIDKLNKLQTSKKEVDLDKLKQLLNTVSSKKEYFSLAVKKADRIILVDYEEIAYLKAEDKYVSIYTMDGSTHVLDKSLNELESNIPDEFIRIHRSVIVNKTYIREIEKYFKGTLILILNNKAGTKLKSSEKYSKDLKLKLGLI